MYIMIGNTDMCGKDYGDESTLTDHKKNMH